MIIFIRSYFEAADRRRGKSCKYREPNEVPTTASATSVASTTTHRRLEFDLDTISQDVQELIATASIRYILHISYNI